MARTTSQTLEIRNGLIGSGGKLLTPSGNCALWVFSEGSGVSSLIFVSDSSNHLVQVFDIHTGLNLRQIGTGEKGPGAGQLNNPRGLLIRQANPVSVWPTLLFVSEFFNHRVQIFDSHLGSHERFIGGKRRDGEPNESALNGPTGLALEESFPGSGRSALLYVADSWNSRIAVFDADTGDYLRDIGSGSVGSPWGLAVRNMPQNSQQTSTIYVLDISDGKVQVFDAASGKQLGSIGGVVDSNIGEEKECNNGQVQLIEPTAVAVWEASPGSGQPSLLYVAD